MGQEGNREPAALVKTPPGRNQMRPGGKSPWDAAALCLHFYMPGMLFISVASTVKLQLLDSWERLTVRLAPIVPADMGTISEKPVVNPKLFVTDICLACVLPTMALVQP